MDGVEYPLEIPSGQTTGLKINEFFPPDKKVVLTENEIALIFDVRDLISYNKGNGYRLTPPVLKETIVEQPNKPNIRPYTKREKQAIQEAENYLENAESISPKEREEYLRNISNVISAECTAYHCTYMLSTYVMREIYYQR